MSDDRNKRRKRRENRIAKDLRTPKYRQRIVKRKPKPEPSLKEFDIDEFEELHDGYCPKCGEPYWRFCRDCG